MLYCYDCIMNQPLLMKPTFLAFFEVQMMDQVVVQDLGIFGKGIFYLYLCFFFHKAFNVS